MELVPLSTSTTSTTSAEVYEALSDAFALVGPLVTAQEATATAVILPNGKILFVGGSNCHAQTYSPGGLCKSLDVQGLPVRRAATRLNCTTRAARRLRWLPHSLGGNPSGNDDGGAQRRDRDADQGVGHRAGRQGADPGGSTGSTFLALSAPPAGCGPVTAIRAGGAEHAPRSTTRRPTPSPRPDRYRDARRERRHRAASPGCLRRAVGLKVRSRPQVKAPTR